MTFSPPHSVTLTPPDRPLVGRVAPPGSKSITNRALLLAALARGRSRLTGALKSDDTARMAEALAAMAVRVEDPDGTTFVVHGSGALQRPQAPLFLGNAGTATRFLTAAAALVDGDVVIDGDANMRKRPIAPLLAALAQLGVTAEAPTGCPPVTIRGAGGFRSGGRVTIDAGLSSQYVSALLMLAGMGDRPTEIALAGDHIGARGYIDLTLAAMARFGGSAGAVAPGVWRVIPRPAWRSSPTPRPPPTSGRRSGSPVGGSISAFARRRSPSPTRRRTPASPPGPKCRP
jgi:3-phosphoshikimate 1-carboxyvinyltransferase